MRILSVFFLLFAASLFLLPGPPQAQAASYDVSATVPAPTPTQAPAFDQSLNTTNAQSELFEIFGTCQSVYPTSIISIWRDGQLIGSTNCQANNTFRLTITLIPGQNILIPKISNINNIAGPDGAPIIINYSPPRNAAPITTSSDLQITTEQPVIIMDNDNQTTISLVISGGTSPYTVTINWGDGTTETVTVPSAGTYSFKHKYKVANIYKVVATVTDVLGVSKVYQFIVTSSNPQAATAKKPTTEQTTTTNSGISNTTLVIFGGILIGLIIMLIALTTFWLGRKYEHRHTDKQLNKKSTLKGAAKRR